MTLEAFRDLSYPLGVGSYDAYAVPRRGFITKVERVNERIRLFGDIELIEKHMRSYDIVRKPLLIDRGRVRSSARPRSAGNRPDDGEGRVVLAGQVPVAADASFHLDLERHAAGRPGFTLSAQLIVNGNAMNADIRRIPIEVASKP